MSTAIRKLYMDWIRDKQGRRIYSSANLKDGTHRMSIPWAPQRGGSVANALINHPDSQVRAEKLLAAFKKQFPELAPKVSYQWHVGSGLYLSLRVAPTV